MLVYAHTLGVAGAAGGQLFEAHSQFVRQPDPGGSRPIVTHVLPEGVVPQQLLTQFAFAAQEHPIGNGVATQLPD